MSKASVIAKGKREWRAVLLDPTIWGELAPWLYFVVTCAFFVVMTLLGKVLNSETLLGLFLSLLFGLFLSFLCWLFFLVLYGRVLCHRASKRIVRRVSLECFLLMGVVFSWLKVVPLMAGVFAIVMGVCVMVCANSWLFRFRGGRIVGLLIVFVAASVLYNKLNLEFDKYPYAREPVVEPFHIANQLVGIVLPVRGQFNKGSVSTVKPLLYEGCHFFIWLFLISLALSFANRELINRLYLKLTQFKPLYVFWSNNGSSEEETVAEDILRGKFFKPNVVLALWGKDKENAADICDKWKRGRRWIEASSVEYDDIASYADAHYILSSDGNANLVKCMELMQHVVHGTIYVRTDGADDCYLKVFENYARCFAECNNCAPSVRMFSEIHLVKNEMKEIGVPDYTAKSNMFLVNYFIGRSFDGSAHKDLLAVEVGLTSKLAKTLKVPDWQVVGCNDERLRRAEFIVFCGIDPRFQIKAIDEYYKRGKPGDSNVTVYAYARGSRLAALLQRCYSGLKIFGAEQSLFTQSRIANFCWRSLRVANPDMKGENATFAQKEGGVL